MQKYLVPELAHPSLEEVNSPLLRPDAQHTAGASLLNELYPHAPDMQSLSIPQLRSMLVSSWPAEGLYVFFNDVEADVGLAVCRTGLLDGMFVFFVGGFKNVGRSDGRGVVCGATSNVGRFNNVGRSDGRGVVGGAISIVGLGLLVRDVPAFVGGEIVSIDGCEEGRGISVPFRIILFSDETAGEGAAVGVESARGGSSRTAGGIVEDAGEGSFLFTATKATTVPTSAPMINTNPVKTNAWYLLHHGSGCTGFEFSVGPSPPSGSGINTASRITADGDGADGCGW